MPRTYSALNTDGTPTVDPEDAIVRRLLAQAQAGGGNARPSAAAPAPTDDFAQFARNQPSGPMVRGADSMSPDQQTEALSNRVIALKDASNGGDPGVRYAQRSLATNRAATESQAITDMDTPDMRAAQRDAALIGVQRGTVAAGAEMAQNDLARIQAGNKAKIARDIAEDGGFLTPDDKREFGRDMYGLPKQKDNAANNAFEKTEMALVQAAVERLISQGKTAEAAALLDSVRSRATGGPGNPIPAATGAFAPTEIERDEASDAALPAAKQSPRWSLAIDTIVSTAKDARNGRATVDDVAQLRDQMVQDLVNRKVAPNIALSEVNAELDKRLPGVTNDILSAVSATVAIPGRLFGMDFNNPYENVGNAGETRSRLGLR